MTPIARRSLLVAFIVMGFIVVELIAANNDISSLSPSLSNSWRQVAPRGDVPVARAYHGQVISADGSSVFVFGGNKGIWELELLNDLYRFDVDTETWTQLLPTGSLPLIRYRMSIAYAEKAGLLLVFGGLHAKGSIYPSEILGDLSIYDIQKNEWRLDVQSQGSKPPARFFHAARCIGDVMYVFGGNDGHQFFNDVHKYYISENRWEKVAATGVKPEARSNAAVAITPSQLFVFGGLRWHGYEGYLNDLFYLDLSTNAWVKPTIHSVLPARRSGCSGVVLDNQLVISGGYDWDGKYHNDVWVLDSATSEWVEQEKTSPVPRPRTAFSAVAIPHTKRMILYGGYADEMVLPATNFNDTWIYEL